MIISRGMLLGIFIAIAALGIGIAVIHAELAYQPSSAVVGTNSPDAVPSSRWLNQQRRAEQKSEQQGIEAACAALRKMGKTDKDCPSQ